MSDLTLDGAGTALFGSDLRGAGAADHPRADRSARGLPARHGSGRSPAASLPAAGRPSRAHGQDRARARGRRPGTRTLGRRVAAETGAGPAGLGTGTHRTADSGPGDDLAAGRARDDGHGPHLGPGRDRPGAGGARRSRGRVGRQAGSDSGRASADHGRPRPRRCGCGRRPGCSAVGSSSRCCSAAAPCRWERCAWSVRLCCIATRGGGPIPSGSGQTAGCDARPGRRTGSTPRLQVNRAARTCPSAPDRGCASGSSSPGRRPPIMLAELGRTWRIRVHQAPLAPGRSSMTLRPKGPVQATTSRRRTL